MDAGSLDVSVTLNLKIDFGAGPQNRRNNLTMETASYHMGRGHEANRMFDTYLFKNPTPSSGRGHPTMSIATADLNNHNGVSYLPNEPFHTPSFGDEEFDIPSLNCMPSVSESLGQTNGYSVPSLTHQQVTSVPNTSINGYSQPLSHPPISSSGQNFTGAYTQNQDSFIPKFPPQNFDIPDINFTNNFVFSQGQSQNHLQQQQQQQNFVNSFATNHTFRVPQNHRHPVQFRSHEPLSTISHTQLSSELGLHTINRRPMDVNKNSPPGSNNTSPIRESSEDSDDSLPLAQLALKRSAAEANNTPVTVAIKKPKTPKKRKKKDPNEPQKPVSAYALFFRDTQAAIKGQNPNASFGEVSKIVASMWDNLDVEQKGVYKKRTETAKKEYLKQLAAYRASLVSKQTMDPMDPFNDKGLGGQKMMSGMGGSPSTVASPTSSAPPLSHYSQPATSPPHMGMPVSPPHMNMMPQHQMAPSPPQQQQFQAIAPRPSAPNMPTGSPVAMPTSPNPMHMNSQGQTYSTASMGSPNSGLCIRNGCHNQAIDNPSWDSEYCSNECVVNHCRDVFTAWVAARQGSGSYASVK